MSVTLEINSPMDYYTNDQPILQGKVLNNETSKYLGTTELIGLTLRATFNDRYYFLKESLTELDTDSFLFKFKEQFLYTDRIQLFARVLWKEAITATLNGILAAGATTANLTVTVGAIPDSGWIVIENEACTFTKLTSNSITIARGKFETTDVEHASATPVYFAITRETAINNLPLTVENAERDLYRNDFLKTKI
jgi:hypothetical protein